MIFRDRRHAGLVLAQRLLKYRGDSGVVVLGLPRGGVPVAYEIAEALDAPLDAFVVRKLGVPGQEELAMGAIASGGVLLLNQTVVAHLKIDRAQIDSVVDQERLELERREEAFGEDGARPELFRRTIILVDDGLATGSTMLAAIAALRMSEASGIIVAVPVSSPDVCARVQAEVDEIVCAARPEPFFSVGTWYQDFTQTTDEEVRALLAANRAALHGVGRVVAQS